MTKFDGFIDIAVSGEYVSNIEDDFTCESFDNSFCKSYYFLSGVVFYEEDSRDAAISSHIIVHCLGQLFYFIVCHRCRGAAVEQVEAAFFDEIEKGFEVSIEMC